MVKWLLRGGYIMNENEKILGDERRRANRRYIQVSLINPLQEEYLEK